MLGFGRRVPMNRSLLIIGLAFIVLGSVGALIYWDSFINISYFEEDETFSAENIQQLDIDASIGKIAVVQGKDKDFKVAYKVADRLVEEKGKPQIELTAGTLKVSLPYKKQGGILSFLPKNHNSTEITVHVPEGHALDELVAKSHVGAIEITDQVIKKVNTSSNLAQTKLIRVQSEAVKMRSDVGSLILNDVTGTVDAKNEVGEIYIQLEEVTGDIQAKTEVGEVTMALSKKPVDATIIAKSQVGSATVFDSGDDHIVQSPKYHLDLRSDVGSVSVKLLGD